MNKAGTRVGLLLAGAAVLFIGALVLWSALSGPPPEKGPDGHPDIVAMGLPAVDNLVIGEDGSLYATLELPAPNGRVVRLSDRGVETVLDRLDRADGLLYANGRLYVTEEVKQGRVLELHLETGQVRTLARLSLPEGIDILPDGALVISEDTNPGRLVRVDPAGQFGIIASGFNRPEGLAVARNGGDADGIFVAETGTGHVLRLHGGRVDVVAGGLREPDQVAFAPDGALWITEDAHPGRVLRLKDGRTTVIAVLNRPQGMAFLKDGRVLVAEQGAGRIVRLTVPPDPATP